MRTLAIAFIAASAIFFAAEAAQAEDVVPEVVGLQLEEARAMLERVGCAVTVTWRSDQPPGLVVSQEPGGRAPMREGIAVRISVGGADPTPRPLPVAPTPGEAPDVGPPAGPAPIVPGLPPTAPEGAAPPSAEPPSTAPVPELSGVAPDRPVNRSGPELPSALSLTEAQAMQALSSWRVNREETIGLPQFVGRVVNQAPNPGETLAAGETVTIVIAVARAPSPEHRSAPTLVGLDMSAAVGAAERAGLSPVLRSVPSGEADRGRVLEQRPLAGSLVTPGTSAFLRVGRGGRGGSAPVAPVAPEVGPPPPVVEPPVPVAPPTPAGQLMAPTLISPSEGQSFPRAYGSTFQWTQVAGAALYEWQLQREDRDGVWQIEATERVEGARYRPARMERGSFRWRVRALGNGTEGPWSTFFRLYMY